MDVAASAAAAAKATAESGSGCAASRSRGVCAARAPAGDAAEFATLVAEALERKDQIELSVKRGAGDAQIASLSGRAVDIKKKRVLQLNYKRRARRRRCEFRRRGAGAAPRGGAAADGLRPRAPPPAAPSPWRSPAPATRPARRSSRARRRSASGAGLDARGGGGAAGGGGAPRPREAPRHLAGGALPRGAERDERAGGAGPPRKLGRSSRWSFDHAVRRADVGAAPRVVDMGCGKGYLTFAARELLAGRFGSARVEGVEARRSLVDASNRAAASLGHGDSLTFREGWIGPCGAFDVLLALHACDTAGHGALADRHAEAVTDALRCLALRLHGFDDARIIEWISSSTRRSHDDRRDAGPAARRRPRDDLRAEPARSRRTTASRRSGSARSSARTRRRRRPRAKGACPRWTRNLRRRSLETAAGGALAVLVAFEALFVLKTGCAYVYLARAPVAWLGS
ncbi:hypothetical protein JL720_12482 [Aureococcus anophagefferens]|nr:hypothetical protein JL720_12482 [Aureococcus anophagefferens]